MCTVQYLLLKFPDIIRIVCIVVQSIYLRYTMRYMLRAEREILARRRWRQLRRERLRSAFSWAEVSWVITRVFHTLCLSVAHVVVIVTHTHTRIHRMYSPRPVAWHRPRLICLLFCYETKLCQGQIYMNTLSAGDVVSVVVRRVASGVAGESESHCSALLNLSELCK